MEHSADLTGDLRVSYSKTPTGYRGALVGRNGRWVWECLCDPRHPTSDEAVECGRTELTKRRRRGSQPFNLR